MQTALIVGAGSIGRAVYTRALPGFAISTLDIDTSVDPTYTDFDQVQGQYDIAIIATPNYLHYLHTFKAQQVARVVLCEKPGVLDADQWQSLILNHPTTMMIKNNQYRSNFAELVHLAKSATTIKFNWINDHRIPNPGGWFTNKKLAFGGVSRDLVPHLLSYLIKFVPVTELTLHNRTLVQNSNLSSITHTNYGTINRLGVYDVDDYARFVYTGLNKTFVIEADWNNSHDDVSIEFDGYKVELGLCPELAYTNMCLTALDNVNNEDFWSQQHLEDIWIHNQLNH